MYDNMTVMVISTIKGIYVLSAFTGDIHSSSSSTNHACVLITYSTQIYESFTMFSGSGDYFIVHLIFITIRLDLSITFKLLTRICIDIYGCLVYRYI